MGSIIVRTVREDDIPAILEIYRPFVQDTSFTFEIVTPTIAEFTQRVAGIANDYPFLVAESDGKIIGYAYGSRYGQRAGYDWTAQVSIYTSPLAKSRGVGAKLYAPLLKLLAAQNIYRLVALVTSPNPNSLFFHNKMGFNKFGRFPNVGYKQGSWHDIVHLEKELISVKDHPNPQPVIPFIKLREDFVIKILDSYNALNSEE